jgi:hypothetical protein
MHRRARLEVDASPIGVTLTPSGFVAPLSSRTLQPAGVPPPLHLVRVRAVLLRKQGRGAHAQNARSMRAVSSEELLLR